MRAASLTLLQLCNDDAFLFSSMLKAFSQINGQEGEVSEDQVLWKTHAYLYILLFDMSIKH